MGPSYARVAHPLRPLLTPQAVWPMNAKQLAAVERLKELLVESHLLAVPDEAAIDEMSAEELRELQKPNVEQTSCGRKAPIHSTRLQMQR